MVQRGDGHKVIIDTKWKSLSPNLGVNYRMSQVDMHRMYTYSKKYSTKDVILLYPLNNAMRGQGKIVFQIDDGVSSRVRFVDLEHMGQSLEEIRRDIQM